MRSFEGSERGLLGPCGDEDHAVRLREAARDLRHRLAGRDAGARGKTELVLDGRGHRPNHAQYRSVVVVVVGLSIERLASVEVDVLLVDARGDHDGAEALDDLARAARVPSILVVMSGHEHGVRREGRRVADRHARVDAVRPRFVARRGDDAASSSSTPDDDRFSLQRGIDQAFDRHEKRVEIEAANARQPHGFIVILNE